MMSDCVLKCPLCGHVNRPDLWDYDGLVTLWGEDDDVDYDCDECGATMLVREEVSRSWDVVGVRLADGVYERVSE